MTRSKTTWTQGVAESGFRYRGFRLLFSVRIVAPIALTSLTSLTILSGLTGLTVSPGILPRDLAGPGGSLLGMAGLGGRSSFAVDNVKSGYGSVAILASSVGLAARVLLSDH